MSFNRLKYDTCESKQDLRQSRGPGLYNLDKPQIRESCLPDNPQIISQRGADTVSRRYPKLYQRGQIEIDSDLKNITRPASNCPSQKYDPRQSNCGRATQGLPGGGGGVVAGCEGTLFGERCGDSEDLTDLVICQFPVENTRLSNPGSNIRGTGLNRFDPLFMNPQDQVLFPGEFNINTNLLARDNHRPCLRRPAINSMDPPQLPMWG